METELVRELLMPAMILSTAQQMHAQESRTDALIQQ
jgi:hypothetical protein